MNPTAWDLRMYAKTRGELVGQSELPCWFAALLEDDLKCQHVGRVVARVQSRKLEEAVYQKSGADQQRGRQRELADHQQAREAAMAVRNSCRRGSWRRRGHWPQFAFCPRQLEYRRNAAHDASNQRRTRREREHHRVKREFVESGHDRTAAMRQTVCEGEQLRRRDGCEGSHQLDAR